MSRRTIPLLSCAFVLAFALAAGCDSGIQTEQGSGVAHRDAPSPAVAPSAAASPASVASTSGGGKKPPKIILVPAPIEVNAPPETVGKSYMEAHPNAPTVTGNPKNNSAMPDPVVDYVRFVRSLEEDRQRHMLGRKAILEQQGAAAPTEEKVTTLLKGHVQEARTRLAKLRARTAPKDCTVLAQMYETALIEDGAEADQDATLVTQALAAAKAGDTAMHDTLMNQLRAPNSERQQRRDLVFGRADGAFVGVCQKYPTSPPDFASIRISDKPF